MEDGEKVRILMYFRVNGKLTFFGEFSGHYSKNVNWISGNGRDAIHLDSANVIKKAEKSMPGYQDYYVEF